MIRRMNSVASFICVAQKVRLALSSVAMRAYTEAAHDGEVSNEARGVVTSLAVVCGSRQCMLCGVSREKRPDCVYENPVLCMHEFIQNSATRFIPCN
eukprot:COSAG02_NODE_10333_length_1966_cov_2.076058_1_plen_96_part_10